MRISGLKTRVDRMAPHETTPMEIKITRNIVSGSGSDGQLLIVSKETRLVMLDLQFAKAGKTWR
jgi:hypothetical protein